MKLSKAQQAVVDAMRNGWQLGEGMDFRGRTWLQQGGCGRGGTTKEVRANTVSALLRAGAIKKDEESFPLRTYKLCVP